MPEVTCRISEAALACTRLVDPLEAAVTAAYTSLMTKAEAKISEVVLWRPDWEYTNSAEASAAPGTWCLVYDKLSSRVELREVPGSFAKEVRFWFDIRAIVPALPVYEDATKQKLIGLRPLFGEDLYD